VQVLQVLCMFVTAVIKCHSISYDIFNANIHCLRCLCYDILV